MLLAAGCAVEEASEVCPISSQAAIEAFVESLATSDPDESSASSAQPMQSRQVLLTTTGLSEGFPVQEVLEDPSAYLRAIAVPEMFACSSTIASVAQLQSLADLEAAVTIEPGRFLDLRQFTATTSE